MLHGIRGLFLKFTFSEEINFARLKRCDGFSHISIGESLFTIFASLPYAIQFLMELRKRLILNIERAQHN